MTEKIEKIGLSIVIPSYLEEENLRLILPRINDCLKKIDIDYEILVIDTNESMDGTKVVCKNFENTKYFNRENGNFYGDAVRTGIEKAQYSKLLFMDADGSHTPEFIEELYKNCHECNVIIASRYVKGGGTDNNKLLIFMSKMVNMIYAIVLNLKCKDVSNSFKIYDTDKIKNIDIYCNNFDIVEEILFKMNKANKGLKIKEIPYIFKERMFGNTKRNLFSFILSYIVTLVKLRFGK